MRHLLPLLLLLLLALPPSSGRRLVIEFFYHSGCEECMERKRLLEKLEMEYFPEVVVEWWNTAEREGMERFMEYNLSRWPAAVFNRNPNTVLYDLREESLREVIEHYLEEGEVAPSKPLKSPPLTIPLVLVSGLIDGINPCALSLLIFFISFLFTLKKGRLRVLGMGLIYILGIYVGYLSIGLGLLRTVTLLGFHRPLAYLGVALLALMGLLQIRDAVGFEAPLLRFPRFAVPSFRGLVERASLPIAFALGVFVSLHEFPCSGSVYVGILILLASRIGFSSGLFYLILYNLMFILPLLLVLLLASNLELLTRMDEWRVAQRRRIKLISGFLLLILSPILWLLLLTH